MLVLIGDTSFGQQKEAESFRMDTRQQVVKFLFIEADQVEGHHAGEVAAKAHDMVIPGHGTTKVSTLRLWKAVAPAHIDLTAFNTGDYARAAGIMQPISPQACSP